MTPKKKPNAATPVPSGAGGVRTAQVLNKANPKAASNTENDVSVRPVDLQLKVWDSAVQLFSRRRYDEAAQLFREAAKGPAVHVADKARSYEQICERQTAKTRVEFRTAEDHFCYGVERLNAGDLSHARTHLSQALRLQPEGDHILYTMALCCGFSGDGNGACENLKRAIDLEPKNRVMAMQDSEFTSLAQQFPALRALLRADVSGEC
jgi:tetratricopeptide (TPR) repeat protein